MLCFGRRAGLVLRVSSKWASGKKKGMVKARASTAVRKRAKQEDANIPRSVILNIVLLNLLNMVIGLWPIHSLGILPRHVAYQTENRQAEHLEPKDGRREQPGYEAVILFREAQEGCHGSVCRDEDEEERHGSRDRNDVVLCPVVGNQPCLAQHREQDRTVHGRTPDPVACYLAVALGEIIRPEKLAPDVDHERVVDSVGDPGEKDAQSEELISLPEGIELRVAVEQASRDELVQNTHRKRWQHSEDDVVQGECPRFIDNLTRKDVLESVLLLMA